MISGLTAVGVLLVGVMATTDREGTDDYVVSSDALGIGVVGCGPL